MTTPMTIVEAPKKWPPRASFTCQGILLFNRKNHKPYLTCISDFGDKLGRSGKPALEGIAGGGGEVIFQATIDGRIHPGLMEADLFNRDGWKFTLLELNGDKIEDKKTFNALLRQYEFGESAPELPLKVLRNGNEEVIFIKPERDESPNEAIIRETLNETGYLTEIVPPEDGAAYMPYNPRVKESGVFFDSDFGEFLVEIEKDYFGNPVGHTVFTFLLQGTGGSENINEHTEIRRVFTIPLDEVVEKLFVKDLASRENAEGFSFKHGLRILWAFKLWKISWRQYLPKDSSKYNPSLPTAYRKFLPKNVQDDLIRISRAPQQAEVAAITPKVTDDNSEEMAEDLEQIRQWGLDKKPADSKDEWEKFLGDYAKPARS